MLQKVDREHSNGSSGPFTFHILKTKGLHFQEREDRLLPNRSQALYFKLEVTCSNVSSSALPYSITPSRFYRWRGWGFWRLSDLPKVIHFMVMKAECTRRFQSLSPVLCHQPLLDMLPWETGSHGWESDVGRNPWQYSACVLSLSPGPKMVGSTV